MTTPAFADLHEELRRALDRNELLLAYQPIMDLGDGALGGVEALLRWNHPVRGLLWPGEFLPGVADAGLSARLSSFVIHRAAAQADAWRSRMPGRPLMVAVNMSASQFASDDLLVQLASAQRSHDLEPGVLALEIHERILFDDIARAGERLASLEELGIRIVVDDFGTAYADAPTATRDGLLLSLVALEEFPVEVVALDRRLWERLSVDAPDAAVVDGAVRIAHRFGFRVLAEGVESAPEAEQLRDCGCDLAQGYYFHRPQSPEYIEILLREARDARREQVLRGAVS
jgi:EAL domain-containing protein (putative c-di-GMP-specific phosphodiesterase class I)